MVEKKTHEQSEKAEGELLQPIESLPSSTTGKRISVDTSKQEGLLLHLAKSGGDSNLVDQVTNSVVNSLRRYPRKAAIDVRQLKVFLGDEELHDRVPDELVVTQTDEGSAYLPGIETAAFQNKHLEVLLENLTIPEEIKEKISELRQKISPIATVTYARKANKDEVAYEGRGVYVDVPVGDDEVTVYLKGVGTQYLYGVMAMGNDGVRQFACVARVSVSGWFFFDIR